MALTNGGIGAYPLAIAARISLKFPAIMGAFLGNKLLKKVTIDSIRMLVACLILVLATGLLLGYI